MTLFILTPPFTPVPKHFTDMTGDAFGKKSGNRSNRNKNNSIF